MKHHFKSMVTRRFKVLLGRLLFKSGMHRRFFRDKAVVVLFHRVDDRYAGDAITCGTAAFREYCDFFQRYFSVVSLRDLVARLQSGQEVGGTLVITFDDGYRDNRAAAEELLRRGMPACFFIATEFIGSETVPAWDARAGIRSEWMTWDDVRSLRDAGFELGAHTKNHVDLGIVAGEDAEEEIRGSARRLSTETAQPVDLFSYPFGRRDQITEANRAAVRRAGFICCPSAYGGVVRKGDDPFRMCRTPISPWHISPYQFGFEAMFSN